MNELFRKFAQAISKVAGGPWAFLVASTITLSWLLLGSVMHFTDTWQLIIGTIILAVTCLIVFLIQNSQSRDTKALNIKLDALIKAIK